MAKRFAFNLDAAVPAAWDFLWAANLKDRAKQERDHLDGDFGKYGRRWYTRTFYICAVDVVAQVRSFAYETAKGQKWGTNGVRGPDYGIRLSGNVDGRVRDWLLRTKDGHNFDRGHISGMRFRPRGEPLGPSEKDDDPLQPRGLCRPASLQRRCDESSEPLRLAAVEGPDAEGVGRGNVQALSQPQVRSTGAASQGRAEGLEDRRGRSVITGADVWDDLDTYVSTVRPSDLLLTERNLTTVLVEMYEHAGDPEEIAKHVRSWMEQH